MIYGWFAVRVRESGPGSVGLAGEEPGTVEEPVRLVENRQENGSIGRVGDMDVSARPPNKVPGGDFTLIVLQRTFQHEGLLEIGMLVQRHDGAGRHLEQDRGSPGVVLIE